MAISLYSTTESGSTSFSVDVGSGSDRFLVVGIGFQGGTGPSSVQYNSVSMTQMGTTGTQYGVDHYELWGLVNPASGSNTLSFTLTSPTTGPYTIALAFDGVDQTSVAGATRDTDTVSHAGGSTSFSLTGVQSTDMTVAGADSSYIYAPDQASWTSITERAEGFGSNNGATMASDLNVSGPSFNMGGGFGAGVAAALIEAASGTEITATLVALTIAEQVASGNFESNNAATNVALTITENQATTALSKAVSAGNVGLTITEQAASGNFESNNAATNVPLTITENAATTELAKSIDATNVALTLTENQSTITLDKNVTATVTALTITEYQSTIGLGTTISAGTVSLTIGENAASVNRAKDVTATSVALTVTEYQAVQTLAKTVVATLASLGITEQNATITLDVDIPATVTALTITAQAAQTASAKNVDASLVNLTINEQASTITSGVEIADAEIARVTIRGLNSIGM